MMRLSKRVTAIVSSCALLMTLTSGTALAEQSEEVATQETSLSVDIAAVDSNTSVVDANVAGEEEDVTSENAPISSTEVAVDDVSASHADSAEAPAQTLPETAPEDMVSDQNKEETNSENETNDEDAEDLYEGVDTSLFAAQADRYGVWTRLWGESAYDTMQVILRTDEAFPDGSGGTVIVATGDGYWDALAASGLAGLSGAPIIITPTGGLNEQAKAEIARIKPTSIIVVGGTSVITPACFEQIRALCPKGTVRVAGPEADDTSVEIFKAGDTKWGKTAVIATSSGYWDALSIAPFAYSRNAPIFLTTTKPGADGYTLSDSVLSSLQSGAFERVVIVGGPNVVSTKVEGQLAGVGLSGDKVKRLYGEVALDTSAEIAVWELTSEKMSTAQLSVATSAGYWDALTGAALTGKQDAILVLVNPGGDYRALDAVYAYDDSVTNGHVYGGASVIKPETLERIAGRVSIEALSASIDKVAVGGTIKFDAAVHGYVDGATYTWSWARPDGSESGSASGSTEFSFRPAVSGVYDVTCTVTAATGETSSAGITVEFTDQGGTAGDLLAVARENIGYSIDADPETGSIFGRWYAAHVGNAVYGWDDIAYCAMAVSYWCNKAGVPAAGLPGAGCENIYFEAQRQGRFVDKSRLEPGMLILFDWDDDGLPDHIGIVENRVDGDTYQTIEGNTSRGIAGSQDNGGWVAQRTRDYDVIIGGVRPDFK